MNDHESSVKELADLINQLKAWREHLDNKLNPFQVDHFNEGIKHLRKVANELINKGG